ncbi:MAG: cytochrome c biogenesis protein CcsA [Gammaproteobacteria bacterium]|jgi:ABC-type uncharacterized transport system permease subunit|nr:cytochrome c biogenesis protein CcsA [Gammaproteobacteria bacterium]MBT3489570.1 cytochrome c biogenesis protein CcsA [Gammaproteobacteria bacterium]MBT3717480.1 cytochrome c biogenesis protein CcsA [Gammaproteobacteria bacterium]MBT3845085.1 cytochrome c biogenesis protein CcsA [Gammaproteobacteria bacterium]MBT3893078.1 cytochrome c biogenesis protein CcsA [Gammaproteobacteria bacterium]
MSYSVSGSIAILLYLIAAVGLGRLLAQGISCFDHPRNGFKLLGAVGVVLHTYVLYTLVVEQWVNLGFFHALSVTGWLLVLLFESTWIFRPVGNLGIIIFPVSSVALLLQILYPEPSLKTASSELDIHILLSMVAYSLLAVAALQAVLLAVQEKHLRNKQPGGIIRALPPMQEVEHLMFQLVRAGLVVLTLALLSAVPLVEDIVAQKRAHTAALSILSWLLFAALLWGRHQYGWRGRTAVRWTLFGFGILFLSYFGSRFVVEFLVSTPAS